MNIETFEQFWKAVQQDGWTEITGAKRQSAQLAKNALVKEIALGAWRLGYGAALFDNQKEKRDL